MCIHLRQGVGTEAGFEQTERAIGGNLADHPLGKRRIALAGQYMIHCGTEVGRDILGQDVWVNALAHKILNNPGRYAIADMRFPNEARYVQYGVQHGFGMTVRVTRDGFGPVADHASETSLDNWKFQHVVNNDGTLEDLAEEANDLVERLRLLGWM